MCFCLIHEKAALVNIDLMFSADRNYYSEELRTNLGHVLDIDLNMKIKDSLFAT